MSCGLGDLDLALCISSRSSYDVPITPSVTLSGCAGNSLSLVTSIMSTNITGRNLKGNLEAGAGSVGSINGRLPSGVNVTRSGIFLSLSLTTIRALTSVNSRTLALAARIGLVIKSIFPFAESVRKDLSYIILVAIATLTSINGVSL